MNTIFFFGFIIIIILTGIINHIAIDREESDWQEFIAKDKKSGRK